MTKLKCDSCSKPIRANTAFVTVNIADEPPRRYHGPCFTDGKRVALDPKETQR